MATQAAVMAGFTTTCIIEITIPINADPLMKGALHIFGILSICSNITCVSLSTITIIWGSGKALRGVDGSMDEAVEGINHERSLIFNSFAVGLGGNLGTVLCACFMIMDPPVAIMCAIVLIYTAISIYANAVRIQNKFMMTDTVRLDDLTRYSSASQAKSANDISGSLLGRGRKSAGDYV
jgi:hypothetical protein